MIYSKEQVGIVVERTFKELNALDRGKVYLTDDQPLFAKAFKQCYFIHGLQQGYCWKDKKVYDLSPEEAFDKVIQYFKDGTQSQ
mgnify:CR=1 FL=1